MYYQDAYTLIGQAMNPFVMVPLALSLFMAILLSLAYAVDRIFRPPDA